MYKKEIKTGISIFLKIIFLGGNRKWKYKLDAKHVK